MHNIKSTSCCRYLTIVVGIGIVVLSTLCFVPEAWAGGGGGGGGVRPVSVPLAKLGQNALLLATWLGSWWYCMRPSKS